MIKMKLREESCEEKKNWRLVESSSKWEKKLFSVQEVCLKEYLSEL